MSNPHDDRALDALDTHIDGCLHLDWEVEAGESMGLEWARTKATPSELNAILVLVRSAIYWETCPDDGGALGGILLPLVAPDRDSPKFWHSVCSYERPPYFVVRGFFSGIAQAIARGELFGGEEGR